MAYYQEAHRFAFSNAIFYRYPLSGMLTMVGEKVMKYEEDGRYHPEKMQVDRTCKLLYCPPGEEPKPVNSLDDWVEAEYLRWRTPGRYDCKCHKVYKPMTRAQRNKLFTRTPVLPGEFAAVLRRALNPMHGKEEESVEVQNRKNDVDQHERYNEDLEKLEETIRQVVQHSGGSLEKLQSDIRAHSETFSRVSNEDTLVAAHEAGVRSPITKKQPMFMRRDF